MMGIAQDVSYSGAREHVADLCDRALSDREPIRLTQRGHWAVILLAADEYEGLLIAGGSAWESNPPENVPGRPHNGFEDRATRRSRRTPDVVCQVR
jgi:hypothetical protein